MSSEEAKPTITPDIYLLKGPMLELKTMTKQDLKQECAMWRNVWQWVPSEVKWYVARTGMIIGLTMRNYNRQLGVLLETHWDLKEVELGIHDKVYDTITGQYYFEKKIVRTKLGGVIDVQVIQERKTEEELEVEHIEMTAEPPEEEEQS